MAAWVLTTAGWGPVRMGSPLPSSLRSQLKPAWECVGPIIRDGSGAERMEFFSGQADGLGTINALHIVSPTIGTRSGIRPGDSLAKLGGTYPKLEVFRAQNSAGSTGDVYTLPDDTWSLFFEIESSTQTIEHISVQRAGSFYPFQQQICGAP